MIKEIWSDAVCRTLLTAWSLTLVVATMLVVLASRSTYAEAAEHVIDIKSFVYNPEILEIRVGDRITWTNSDFVSHTATAVVVDGQSDSVATQEHSVWTTGEILAGEKKTIVATESMILEYFCRYHTAMKASLLIK